MSFAWLCFDKEKGYVKHGKNYVKCNQPRCGAEYKLSSSTSRNLSRHVEQKHRTLLPKKKAGINQPKQMTLSLSGKQKIIPNFSQDSFKHYLTNLIVVQDLPFLLLESTEFKDFIHLLRPETRVVKADALKNWIMDRFK